MKDLSWISVWSTTLFNKYTEYYQANSWPGEHCETQSISALFTVHQSPDFHYLLRDYGMEVDDGDELTFTETRTFPNGQPLRKVSLQVQRATFGSVGRSIPPRIAISRWVTLIRGGKAATKKLPLRKSYFALSRLIPGLRPLKNWEQNAQPRETRITRGEHRSGEGRG